MPTPSTARLHSFSVVINEGVAEDIFRLVISAPACAQRIQPGQFMNFEVPGNTSELLRIPLSYAGADAHAGIIELFYALRGAGTQRLSEMRARSTSTLIGPAGHGWTVPADSSRCKRALLVAGGIGMPPILCLARALSAHAIPFDVCVGAASTAKLICIDALKSAGAERISVATDDGSEGYHGVCTELASKLMEAEHYDYVASCGPAPMMQLLAQEARVRNIFCEVSLERMMSCGFGACGTCAVNTLDGMKGACMAGPVFDASRVVVF